MLKVLCVAGARPNYMKIKPVMDALEERDVAVTLVHTGQHYDWAMNDVFFEELGIREPDVYLSVGSGSHAEQTARTMTSFEPVVADLAPDVVVVAGDVNGTMACALVTAKGGPLLAHVESGLRSRDWHMPEEINRVVTDRVSDFLLAPSDDAVENLRTEGYREDQIFLVGNVMADTLLTNLPRALTRDTASRIGVTPGAYGLVTLHRPANVDDPKVLAGLLVALAELGESLPLVFPVHPRTRSLLEGALPKGVIPVEPLGYLDFIALQAGAAIVLTDSGGIQEETTVLGVPCVTLRDNTERPITIEEGTNVLAGRDPTVIVPIARRLLSDPPPKRKPALWDGQAAQRIAAALLDDTHVDRLRPTALAVTELA